jgi:hypothetical protein
MVLSKSSILKGMQCSRQLYLYKYHYDLMDQISDSQQAIFDNGHLVGKLAQDLFPGGVDCSPDSARDYLTCVEKTSQQIKKGAKIIYEAGFMYNDVVVICDILVIKNKAVEIYEVKSSTKVSDVNIIDAAIQYYVVSKAGLKIKDISVVTLNNQYVRKGKLELKKLFSIDSVADIALEKQSEITSRIKEFRKLLSSKKEPVTDIGPHCNDPYECSFHGHCWNKIPAYSIFNISRLKSDKKFDLYRNGIINIEDVPVDYPLSSQQRLQVDTHNEGKTIVEQMFIGDFLKSLSSSLYFIDFETFMPAVPMFDNSRPYQQIPFQYSVHHLDKNKKLTHSAFLADSVGDPRRSFIKNLLDDTKGKEDILVYNKTFEVTRLNELADEFPEYKKEIENRINRIKDLMLVFQNKWYYTPEMLGQYSIKNVLPALVPKLSYDDLEIGDGSSASRMFESLYYETDEIKTKTIRKNLFEYCKTDTLAMVEILKVLQKLNVKHEKETL